MNLSYLAFNFDKPLMRDVKLRRAISQAIDRKRIIETIYHHNATIANNIIPNISGRQQLTLPIMLMIIIPNKLQIFYRIKTQFNFMGSKRRTFLYTPYRLSKWQN